MKNINIRTAHLGDEEILAHIQTESWKSAFYNILTLETLEQLTEMERTVEMYRRVLSNSKFHLNIEEIDGKAHCIAAWGKNLCNLGENVAELICIHSLPDKWYKGYGSIMMEKLLFDMKEQHFSEVILWVFENNLPARKFYEKHGFVLTEHTQNSFGATELMYSKNL